MRQPIRLFECKQRPFFLAAVVRAGVQGKLPDEVYSSGCTFENERQNMPQTGSGVRLDRARP